MVALIGRAKRNYLRGTLSVEAAFVLPFLIFSTIISVELGRAINQYLTLTRVVYEGSRFAATIPGLTAGTVMTADCNPLVLPCNAPMMRFRNRINQLLQLQRFPAGTYNLTTAVQATRPGQPGNYLTISVEVETQFNSPVRPLRALLSTIGTKVTGPYLFPDP